jgi:hypothetical protein
MGDEQVDAAVDQHLAEVDREPDAADRPQPAFPAPAPGRPSTQGSAQVAPEQAQDGRGPAGPPRLLDDLAGLAVGAHHHGVVG